METNEIRKDALDRNEGRYLDKLQNSKGMLDWHTFLQTLGDPMMMAYSAGTRTYPQDGLLCMHRAKQGDSRAIQLRDKYMLWLLSK